MTNLLSSISLLQVKTMSYFFVSLNTTPGVICYFSPGLFFGRDSHEDILDFLSQLFDCSCNKIINLISTCVSALVKASFVSQVVVFDLTFLEMTIGSLVLLTKREDDL